MIKPFGCSQAPATWNVIGPREHIPREVESNHVLHYPRVLHYPTFPLASHPVHDRTQNSAEGPLPGPPLAHRRAHTRPSPICRRVAWYSVRSTTTCRNAPRAGPREGRHRRSRPPRHDCDFAHFCDFAHLAAISPTAPPALLDWRALLSTSSGSTLRASAPRACFALLETISEPKVSTLTSRHWLAGCATKDSESEFPHACSHAQYVLYLNFFF